MKLRILLILSLLSFSGLLPVEGALAGDKKSKSLHVTPNGKKIPKGTVTASFTVW